MIASFQNKRISEIVLFYFVLEHDLATHTHAYSRTTLPIRKNKISFKLDAADTTAIEYKVEKKLEIMWEKISLNYTPPPSERKKIR